MRTKLDSCNRLVNLLLALLCLAALGSFSAFANNDGKNFSINSPQELFEMRLRTELESTENWPDLVVLYQGRSQAFEGGGHDYLLLEVNSYSNCWDSARQRLRQDQLTRATQGETNSTCMVSSIQRFEVPQLLPLRNGGYSKTRLLSISGSGAAIKVSAPDRIHWIASSEIPRAISDLDILASLSGLLSRDLAEASILKFNYNLSRNTMADPIPLYQVFAKPEQTAVSG